MLKNNKIITISCIALVAFIVLAFAALALYSFDMRDSSNLLIQDPSTNNFITYVSEKKSFSTYVAIFAIASATIFGASCIILYIYIRRWHTLLEETNLKLSRTSNEILSATIKLEREKKEKEQKEQKIHAIIDGMVDPVITFDEEGNIDTFSPATLQIFGYKSDEFKGANIRKIVPQKSLHSMDPILKYIGKQTSSEEDKQGIKLEINAQRKDESLFTCVFTVTKAKINENYMCIGVIRDITERIKKEEELNSAIIALEVANKVKSDFLSNMSHEIRTPMNGIMGVSSLLANTKLNTEQKDYVATLKNSSKLLLNIVNDVLDISKIENGKMVINEVSFNLNSVVEEVVHFVYQSAHAKNIDFIYDYTHNTPRYFIGDCERICQIINNLVSNAIKFTDEGRVYLKVECTKETKTKAHIRVAIEDTGIGIKQKHMDKIFEKFNQVDNSDTRKHGGTGIGLAISKQLAELMKGSIEVQSIYGEGSTFAFNIPLRLDKNHKGKSLATPSISNLKILIIDESDIKCRATAGYFLNQDIKTNICSNSAEALIEIGKAQAEGKPYDVAIINSNMPVMNGFTIAKVIKHDPNVKNTHLILLTDLKQREKTDTDLFLSLIKPISEEKLITCISSIYKGKTYKSKKTKCTKISEAKAKSKKSSNALDSAKILIVEDQPLNQKMVTMSLNKLGYKNFSVANNGIEALDVFKAESFNLILMDCQMPKMDGFEATKEIRKLEKKSKGRTPIVAITADVVKADRKKCLDSGMDDFFNKPLTLTKLEEILNKWL